MSSLGRVLAKLPSWGSAAGVGALGATALTHGVPLANRAMRGEEEVESVDDFMTNDIAQIEALYALREKIGDYARQELKRKAYRGGR